MVIDVSDSNFEELVLKSNKPVLVDFWAEWCGPCRMIGPIVKEMSTDYDGRAVMAKIDVDENPTVVEKYGVRNIPTLLFFKNGELIDKHVGATKKSILSEKLEALL